VLHWTQANQLTDQLTISNSCLGKQPSGLPTGFALHLVMCWSHSAGHQWPHYSVLVIQHNRTIAYTMYTTSVPNRMWTWHHISWSREMHTMRLTMQPVAERDHSKLTHANSKIQPFADVEKWAPNLTWEPMSSAMCRTNEQCRWHWQRSANQLMSNCSQGKI